MEDLDKEEYVYLVTITTTDIQGSDSMVIPFKTAQDCKKAMLNIIANNIKHYKTGIHYITYDDNYRTDAFIFAKIAYTNGKSKTCKAIRRKVREVK